MNEQDELKLLRMEVEFLRQSRDEWKLIADKYEEMALSYQELFERERTMGKTEKERESCQTLTKQYSKAD